MSEEHISWQEHLPVTPGLVRYSFSCQYQKMPSIRQSYIRKLAYQNYRQQASYEKAWEELPWGVRLYWIAIVISALDSKSLKSTASDMNFAWGTQLDHSKFISQTRDKLEYLHQISAKPTLIQSFMISLHTPRNI